MPYDVIILGVGPSGSHLVSRLARLSYDVLVVDKKTALVRACAVQV